MTATLTTCWRAVDRYAGGLAGDLGLYAASAVFATVTAATSTLLPHRAWGATAATGYLLAAGVVIGQLVVRRRAPGSRLTGTTARAVLTGIVWGAVVVAPMVLQSVQRAGGRTDRAQEEVTVIEQGGARLLEHGSPYLTRDAIAALPAADQLLGYLPYQPGMALFGLPRAAYGTAWWADARIWFALATTVALTLAIRALRGSSHPPARAAVRDAVIVRAVQFATVLPICALTLVTGGDDLPVLALCLLALALSASRRYARAGLAVGLAAALKLFAWPVALVLLVRAATRGRRMAVRVAAGAVGLPTAALVPAQLVDSAALMENVLRFPLGHGLVGSPARSPFPGYLIASTLPAGRVVAAGLLVAAGLAIAVQLARRPPRTAAATAMVCGYGLLAAILLMPTTRFGYLLYPIALLAWAPAVRLAETPLTERPFIRTPPPRTPLAETLPGETSESAAGHLDPAATTPS